MRIFAFVSLLAVLSPPDCCERRNAAVCSSDPGFNCGDGQTCSIPQGETVGMCIQVQCTAAKDCSAEAPICSMGLCVPCSDSSECLAPTPQCQVDGGRCVECLENKDCVNDVSKSVCDTGAHTCRACALHSECGSGVCAKDSAFANLDRATPIPQGACVPAGRVKTIDGGNFAAINSAFLSANQTTPYVLLKAISGSAGQVSVPVPPDNLPTLYLIGPTADTPPSKLTSQPAVLTNSMKTMVLAAGGNLVIEGLVFSGAPTAIEPAAGSTTLRIVRSMFLTNQTAVKTHPGCDLHIDSSWFGKTAFNQTGGNTILSLDLDSTSLELVNSVFLRNGSTPNNTGGIQMTNTGAMNPSPLVRIVNSTFVDMNINSTGGHNALAVDCTSQTLGRVSIVNSLFLNSSAPSGVNTYVYSNCRQNTPPSLAGVASNEGGLTGMNTVTDMNLGWTNVLVDPASSNLHYDAAAPIQLTAGGVASFGDTAGTISAPTVDIEYKVRPTGQISIGAFQN